MTELEPLIGDALQQHFPLAGSGAADPEVEDLEVGGDPPQLVPQSGDPWFASVKSRREGISHEGIRFFRRRGSVRPKATF